MPDLSGILSMGSRALMTQQRAIDVTGHNISNANTEGYSRQRVNMTTSMPISYNPGQMGTGVCASEIQRIYDQHVGERICASNQDLARWQAQQQVLERVEITFNETSGYGLNDAMSQFWNAWSDLANNPSGYSERVALLGKSEVLTATFKGVHDELKQIQQDTNPEIAATVGEINAIASQIADLNLKIGETEINGQNANDFRDERDLLLKRLSGLIDIETFEGEMGMVSVTTCGGHTLVEKADAWPLSTTVEPLSGKLLINWADQDGNTSDITDAIAGGKLQGLIVARDTVIPGYISQLEDLADSLTASVNAVHRDLEDNTTGDPVVGIDFFTGNLGSQTLAVNPLIAADVSRIAASGYANPLPGDNRNALAIAELQNELLMSGGSVTLDGFYSALVGGVGSDVQMASIQSQHQQTVLGNLENFRESVSGVSLDEEMVNLIKFQHAYDAAAKLIVTVDEMLETVINMV